MEEGLCSFPELELRTVGWDGVAWGTKMRKVVEKDDREIGMTEELDGQIG